MLCASVSPHCSSGLSPLMLTVLLNMLKVLHEHLWQTVPFFPAHPLSPQGTGDELTPYYFFFCRKTEKTCPRRNRKQYRSAWFSSWVSSFCRGSTNKPTAHQQTWPSSGLGCCCPWGKLPVSITALGLSGALVASQVFRWRPQLGAAGAESASEGSVWVEAPRSAGRPRGTCLGMM